MDGQEISEEGVWLLYDHTGVPMVMERSLLLEEDNQEDYIHSLEVLPNPLAETMIDLAIEIDSDLIYHANFIDELQLIRQESRETWQTNLILKTKNHFQKATLDIDKKEYKEGKILEFANDRIPLRGPYLSRTQKTK